MNFQGTRFILPGARPGNHHQPTNIKLKALCAIAYSRLWNRRNIEHNWYGFWGEFWIDFTRNTEQLLTFPQYCIYYVPETATLSSSRRHPVVAAGDAENLADRSIDSSTSTQAEGTVISLFPDFAIVCIRYEVINPAAQIPSFHHYKVRELLAPLIAENKRRPPRRLVGGELYEAATVRITEAQTALIKQARCLFTMYPHQGSVILVACSGEFWSFRIIERDNVDIIDASAYPNSPDAHPNPLDTDFDPVEEDVGGFDDNLAEIHDDEDMGPLVEPTDVHQFVEPVLQMIPAMPLQQPFWSLLFRIDTTASNQRLSMILDELHRIVGTMRDDEPEGA